MAIRAITMAAALALAAGTASGEPRRFELDSSHSQIVFSYNHLGFSTTYGMFSGFEGVLMLDEDSPANSSVEVRFPVTSMLTGWERRFEHFMGRDFFNAGENDMVSFRSTGVEMRGDAAATVTGDLTVNGVTREIALDAALNKLGRNPRSGVPWVGFDATATLKRSDFGLGRYAPAVGDEIEVLISIEARLAE